MSVDISVAINQIAEQIKKQLRERMQNAAHHIADELTQQAKNSINDFYGWNPLMYKRTFGTQDTFDRLYHNHGDSVTCGVRLQAPGGSYPNYNGKKSVSGDWIFQLTYSGKHGAAQFFPWPISNFPPTMSPSPIERIMEKRDALVGGIDSYF